MSSTLIFQGVYFWLRYLQIWHASDSPDFRNGLTNYRFSIFKSNLMPGNPRVYCGLHPLLLYTRIEKSIEPLQKKLEDTNSKKWRVSPCKAMPRGPRGQVSLLEWSIVVLRPKRDDDLSHEDNGQERGIVAASRNEEENPDQEDTKGKRHETSINGMASS